LEYVRLLWPDFVEVNGMVFLREEQRAQPDLADVAETLKRFSNRTQMEQEFNLVEVPMLFASAAGADDQAILELANSLRDTWLAKLERDFPGRRFVVEVLEGDLDDPTIRFHMIR
jgi:hypothetical protein